MITVRHVESDLLTVSGVRDRRCPTCGAVLAVRDELVVDLDANVAIADGQVIELPRGQAELLYALARGAPRLCSYESLAVALWGTGEWPENWHKVISVQVAHLRRALKRTRYGIVNEYGEGYRLIHGAA